MQTLSLFTPQQAQHKGHITGVTQLTLEAVELGRGSTYEARLRVQLITPEDAVAEQERYEGQWSEWCQPVFFPSLQRQGGHCVAAALWGSGLGLPSPVGCTLLPFNLPGTVPEAGTPQVDHPSLHV